MAFAQGSPSPVEEHSRLCLAGLAGIEVAETFWVEDAIPHQGCARRQRRLGRGLEMERPPRPHGIVPRFLRLPVVVPETAGRKRTDD